jgi:hypothetical protein
MQSTFILGPLPQKNKSLECVRLFTADNSSWKRHEYVCRLLLRSDLRWSQSSCEMHSVWCIYKVCVTEKMTPRIL